MARTSLNAGFKRKLIEAGISHELALAVMAVCSFHVGRENAISRDELMRELRDRGFKEDERSVRMAISNMRSQLGIPLAGTGGIKGGYWILKDKQEADDYIYVQLQVPGKNLLLQASKVKKAFDRYYPNGQLKLPTV